MKIAKWLVAIGLTFAFISSGSAQITINGSYKAAYGSALATQVLSTTALKNYLGDTNSAAGSELDAAYGFVSNGVLYLFLAGNLDSGAVGCNNGCVTYDKLNVFFMSDTGAGGNNMLGTNYNTAADFGDINRMGVSGDSNDIGSAGLTFDASFFANYWIGVNVGPTNPPNSSLMSANYEVICANCPGYFLGKSTPPSGTLVPSGAAENPYGIQIAINNSNTNGVLGDINGCWNSVDGGGITPANNPLLVSSGVEMAIPLGALGSPLNSVSVCAFIANSTYASLYNQVLPPVSNMDALAGCSDPCATDPPGGAYELSCDGDSSEVYFPNFPGNKHYFTLAIPPCNSVQLSPASVTSPDGGGTNTETVSESGSCPWTASSGTNWITILSGANGSGNGSFTYSVSPNSSAYPRTGTITIAGQIVTQTVSVTEDGTGALLSAIFGNGTLNPAYGCPLSVQEIGTSYGKNASTNIMAAGGSELDAAYGLVLNHNLFLFLAGNIQDNGNQVMIFFMTGPGGTNTLVGNQCTNVDVYTSAGITQGVLNWMGPTNNMAVSGDGSISGPGLTFDPGFAPTYFMDVHCNTTNVYFNYAQLWPGGTNASGIATNGYYLGSNGGTNGILTGGINPFGIQATINNSNTNGVSAGAAHNGCYTNGNTGLANSLAAMTVSNGIELGIPLAAFGDPTGQIAVCAFIANNTGLEEANQFLGPVWDGTTTYCLTGPGRTTNTWAPFLNLGTLPGTHYFYVGPEMRVTSVTATNVISGPSTNKNFNVNCLTENNTNLLYLLQRTFAPLSTNSTWSPVGGYQMGTGGIITFTDPNGGTNKPGVFYRIVQEPNCQAP
jgi:hypothetical protein